MTSASPDSRDVLVQALAAARALVSNLESGLAALDGEAVDVPRQGRWTRPMLAQLWSEARHLPGVRALFATTAASAGEPVPYADVLAASGLDEMQQRNEHARLSRICGEMFGTSRGPIESWQGPPRVDGARMIYRMHTTIAAWWRELAAETGDR